MQKITPKVCAVANISPFCLLYNGWIENGQVDNSKEPDELMKSLGPDEIAELDSAIESVNQLEEVSDGHGHTSLTRDQYVPDISDYELAVATYVKYEQSRDAMGKVWIPNKFKSNDTYHCNTRRLYDVTERLEGVNVFTIDARFFYHSNDCGTDEKSVLKYFSEFYFDFSCAVVILACQKYIPDSSGECGFIRL